jgi:hypothetical protein
MLNSSKTLAWLLGNKRALTGICAVGALVACREMTNPLRDLFAPAASGKYLNAIGTNVVTPQNMRGWNFYYIAPTSACVNTATCQLVDGPSGVPLGTGSVMLLTASPGLPRSLALNDYGGVRFANITALSYWTLRQGTQKLVQLKFDVDYDLADQDTSSQGTITFDPLASGDSTSGWHQQNALSGKWFGSSTSPHKNGVVVTNPCRQSTPCTWAEVLAAFPNIGIPAASGTGTKVQLVQPLGPGATAAYVDGFAIGISGQTTTFDFELVAHTVPAIAPDTVPSGYDDVSKTISGGTYWNGILLPDVAVVSFTRTADQASRQAAVDAISGTVIGGRRAADDGIYLIRIPSDGTPGPLFAALAQLHSLPQVSTAMPEAILVGGLTYRRPNDGAGYGSSDWKLFPDSAFGNTTRKTWALEVDNAPMAWGCSVGGSTRIGVMDMGIHRSADLAPNIERTSLLPSSQENHGTRVASVLAARGNDSVGTVGMMWRANLHLYDVQQSIYGIAIRFNGKPVSSVSMMGAAIENMLADQVRVINISLGDSISVGQGPPTAAMNTTRALTAGWVADMERKWTPVYRPLWVISAANLGNNVSSYWSYLTAIADSMPSETLIVSAAGSTKKLLAPGATGAGHIDITAPGEDVWVSDSNAVLQQSGASFAAPQVTGAAGLLFAFDSTLTADSVQAYLIRGAKAGNRFAGGFPILDAYQALRVAAQRTGAPLCGNRVYSHGTGEVVAVRGLNIPDETLFTSNNGQPYTDLLNVLHGGKRIQIGDYLEYAWSASTRQWASTAISGDYHQDAGGAFLSWYDGTEHDGNTYAVANGVLTTGGSIWTVDLYPNKASGLRRTLTPSQPFSFAELWTDVCTIVPDNPEGGYNAGLCQWPYITGSGWRESVSDTQIAYAPQGNFVLVGANRRFHEEIVYPPSVPCTIPPYDDPAHCATFLPERDSSVSVELYMVDTRAGAHPWQQIPVSISSTGVNVKWLAIDETGTELVWELGKDVSNATTKSCTQRVIEYIALPNHPSQPAGSLLKSVALPDVPIAAHCQSFGTATFSPFKATPGSANTAVRKARTRAMIRQR